MKRKHKSASELLIRSFQVLLASFWKAVGSTKFIFLSHWGFAEFKQEQTQLPIVICLCDIWLMARHCASKIKAWQNWKHLLCCYSDFIYLIWYQWGLQTKSTHAKADKEGKKMSSRETRQKREAGAITVCKIFKCNSTTWWRKKWQKSPRDLIDSAGTEWNETARLLCSYRILIINILHLLNPWRLVIFALRMCF